MQHGRVIEIHNYWSWVIKKTLSPLPSMENILGIFPSRVVSIFSLQISWFKAQKAWAPQEKPSFPPLDLSCKLVGLLTSTHTPHSSVLWYHPAWVVLWDCIFQSWMNPSSWHFCGSLHWFSLIFSVLVTSRTLFQLAILGATLFAANLSTFYFLLGWETDSQAKNAFN